MIVVFAELGGERLLGKAREIADSLGLRVLAICSAEGQGRDSHRLISLGADEVIKYSGCSTLFEWSEALSSLIIEQKEIKLLLGISGLLTDAILGRAYALARERVGSFGSGLDSVSESEAIKNLRIWNLVFHIQTNVQDKVSILSFKISAVPEPFEDDSRSGKTSDLKVAVSKQKPSPDIKGIKGEYLDSSGTLTVLIDESFAKNESQVSKLASKYMANVVTRSSQVQDIYGPCLAIGVDAKHESELPNFHEELISINESAMSAISNIADMQVVTNDITSVLQDI